MQRVAQKNTNKNYARNSHAFPWFIVLTCTSNGDKDGNMQRGNNKI